MTIASMNPAEIQFVTLHCAATPEGRAFKAADVTRWDIERFGQPSYHWVIELDGTVTQTLRENQRGAHVGGHNTGNLGICYVGGVDAEQHPKDTRTAAQKQAMKVLLREIIARHPAVKIRGHRDWLGVHKDCPSFCAKDWLNSVGLGDHFG